MKRILALVAVVATCIATSATLLVASTPAASATTYDRLDVIHNGDTVGCNGCVAGAGRCDSVSSGIYTITRCIADAYENDFYTNPTGAHSDTYFLAGATVTCTAAGVADRCDGVRWHTRANLSDTDLGTPVVFGCGTYYDSSYDYGYSSCGLGGSGGTPGNAIYWTSNYRGVSDCGVVCVSHSYCTAPYYSEVYWLDATYAGISWSPTRYGAKSWNVCDTSDGY